MCFKKKKIDRYQYYLKCINAPKEEYFRVVNNYIGYYSNRAREYKRYYYIGCFVKCLLLAGILVIQSITETARACRVSVTRNSK